MDALNKAIKKLKAQGYEAFEVHAYKGAIRTGDAWDGDVVAWDDAQAWVKPSEFTVYFSSKDDSGDLQVSGEIEIKGDFIKVEIY